MGIKEELGKKIKRIRQNKMITQENLAEKAEISQRTLSGIETGENFVTAETLDKIVNVLDITYEELFSLSHLKSREELLKEINSDIRKISSDREKLEVTYKFIKSILND